MIKEEAALKAEEDEDMGGAESTAGPDKMEEDEESDAGSEDLEAESSGSEDEEEGDEEGDGDEDMEMGDDGDAKAPAQGSEQHQPEVMVH